MGLTIFIIVSPFSLKGKGQKAKGKGQRAKGKRQISKSKQI